MIEAIERKIKMPDQIAAVRPTRAYEVKVGQTIWAPDDWDWFTVHKISDGYKGFEFRRADGSVADFKVRALVLVRLDLIDVLSSQRELAPTRQPYISYLTSEEIMDYIEDEKDILAGPLTDRERDMHEGILNDLRLDLRNDLRLDLRRDREENKNA
jgi:hypothetical protein